MPNAGLRLDDLVSRGKIGRVATKLMNVKVPTSLLERITALAGKMRVKKTELVIAILNEGLDTADTSLRGWRAPPKPVIPRDRRCTVSGCDREKVAKGICATHYQAQRRAEMG